MSRFNILTCSGMYFDFLDPKPETISINDIAHSLAHQCRFNGHTNDFYSVAQHSVLTSFLVPREHALAALLHDAAEAYLGDVVRPLKHMLPDYQSIEANVEKAVLAKFGISELPECVHRADRIMLATELRDLMGVKTDTPEWEWLKEAPTVYPVKPMNPITAYTYFISSFHRLAKVVR